MHLSILFFFFFFQIPIVLFRVLGELESISDEFWQEAGKPLEQTSAYSKALIGKQRLKTKGSFLPLMDLTCVQKTNASAGRTGKLHS